MAVDTLVFPIDGHYTRRSNHKACDINDESGIAFVVIDSFPFMTMHHRAPFRYRVLMDLWHELRKTLPT